MLVNTISVELRARGETFTHLYPPHDQLGNHHPHSYFDATESGRPWLAVYRVHYPNNSIYWADMYLSLHSLRLHVLNPRNPKSVQSNHSVYSAQTDLQ